MPKTWYALTASASKGVEIRLFDEIGRYGISARDLLNELDPHLAGDKPITLAINSPGGDVFEANAIYNVLARHRHRITARVDGVALSAASLVLMAAGKVVMPANALLMLHNPWSIVAGDATELRRQADLMDKIRDGIVMAYQHKSGLTDTEIKSLMDAETWLSGQEALDRGFADEMESPVELTMCVSREAIRAYQNTPTIVLQAIEPDESQPSTETDAPAAAPPPTPPGATLALNLIKACHRAGLDAFVEPILMRLEAQPDTDLEAELANASAIRDLCMTARLPELAGNYIAAGLAPDAVRARLFDRLVIADQQTEILSAQPGNSAPPVSASATKEPKARAIYRDRQVATRKEKP